MEDYYWGGWYIGWGWVLGLGLIMVIFSMFVSWGYTYRVRRRFFKGESRKDAFAALNERYVRGEIEYKEYEDLKTEILSKNKKI